MEKITFIRECLTSIGLENEITQLLNEMKKGRGYEFLDGFEQQPNTFSLVVTAGKQNRVQASMENYGVTKVSYEITMKEKKGEIYWPGQWVAIQENEFSKMKSNHCKNKAIQVEKVYCRFEFPIPKRIKETYALNPDMTLVAVRQELRKATSLEIKKVKLQTLFT